MKNIAFLAFLIFLSNTILSQYWKDSNYHNNFFNTKKVGICIDIPIISQVLHDKIIYQPLILQVKFAFPFQKKPRFIFFSWNILPQINPVITRLGNEIISKEMEIGINLEFQTNIKVYKNTAIYGAIGVGPHYVSTNTKRQVSGYLFSDNIIVGMRQKINQKLEMNLHYKFRHISNANLKLPNWGINNYCIGISIITSF